MNAFEELMNNRWILKSKEKEKYYRVKDELPTYKNFLTEKLGYRLIVNPYLIKLEKLPGEPKAWMGILDFIDPEDYSFLCFTLMFLEDKEVEEQFVLSQLTEYIDGMFEEGGTDWTVFANRRKLVRVIKFSLKNQLFAIDEGDESDFALSHETEVLFENTGYSKYFMRVFARDISGFTKPTDFYASEWVDMDEDRGMIRRQRVYRKLLLSLGVYKDGQNEEDFAYIKNYRHLIEGDFEGISDYKLQVHRASAYLIVGEDGDLGRAFPAANSLSDAILQFNGELSEKVKNGSLQCDVNEKVDLTWMEMEDLVVRFHTKYVNNFAKSFREMEPIDFAHTLIEEMEKLDFLEVDEGMGTVTLYPICGKVTGSFGERGIYDCE